MTGSITSDGADIEIGPDRKINTLVLLRLYKEINFGNPVHIVVEGMAFKNSGGLADFERHEYFYNEHTCPWNYLRLPIKEGEDTDPHGIFVHQETIKRPDNYSGHLNEIEEWKKLFPSLSSEMTEDSQ